MCVGLFIYEYVKRHETYIHAHKEKICKKHKHTFWKKLPFQAGKVEVTVFKYDYVDVKHIYLDMQECGMQLCACTHILTNTRVPLLVCV